jgi:hypothetical protein
MRTFLVALGAGLALASAAQAGATAEDAAGPAKAQTCQVAEVNPVTGHVFCIKPHGAPVEAPKRDDIGCKEETREAADWTWGPKCKG